MRSAFLGLLAKPGCIIIGHWPLIQDGSGGNANAGRGLRSEIASPPVPRRRVFAFVGRGDPLMLLLGFKAMLFGRAGKSGRPPPLEPSLKVHRDIAHNQSSGFAVAPRVKGLNARGPLKVHPKWCLGESVLAHHAIEGIDRHMKPAAAGLTSGLPESCRGHFRLTQADGRTSLQGGIAVRRSIVACA